MINPLEPSDGLLAQSADEFWGPWLQPNWIGFRLTDSGKYELLADPNFFEIERIESDPTISDKNTFSHQQYLKAQQSYEALRERYIQKGNLYPSDNSREPWRALTHSAGRRLPRVCTGNPFRDMRSRIQKTILRPGPWMAGCSGLSLPPRLPLERVRSRSHTALVRPGGPDRAGEFCSGD